MKIHGSTIGEGPSQRIDQDVTRIVGCACGWRMPPGIADSDDVFAAHYAITRTVNRTVEKERGHMTKKQHESAFNGMQVFCATMFHQRQTLGETVTAWLKDARARRPGFQLVDIVIRQSSDKAFHCITIVVVFNEDLTVSEEKRHG